VQKGLKESQACNLPTNQAAKNVDEYISAAPKEVQAKLREVRAAIRDAAPTARESISYRIPYYDYKGRLAWFGLQKAHIGARARAPPGPSSNRLAF